MTHSQAQRASEEPVESSESAIDPSLRRVLELARWAPSPDNVQPWRFEVTSPRSLIVHGHAEKELGIYDLLGRGGQIAMGAHPLVDDENDKPTVIALREIAAGLMNLEILDEIDAKERAMQVLNDPFAQCRIGEDWP